MVRPVDHFRQAIVRAKEKASPGGTEISEQEARAALYPVLNVQDSFEREAVVQDIRAMLSDGSPLSAKVRALLDEVATNPAQPLTRIAACWKTWTLARASSAGASSPSRSDLQDFVTMVRSRGDSTMIKQAALELARTIADPVDWQAVAGSPAVPEAPPRSAQALKLFSDSVARLARGGACIDQSRALAAFYLLAKGVDPADAGLLPEAIEKALAQATWSPEAAAKLRELAAQKPSTPVLFDCWLSHAAVADGPEGPQITEAELREGLALLSLQGLAPEERATAVERLRTASLTATARKLLEVELSGSSSRSDGQRPGSQPPAAPPSAPGDRARATAEALDQFRALLDRYRQPGSACEQIINLSEALSALYLLAADVDQLDRPAVTDAVRSALASGNLASRAAQAFQTFVDNPAVDAPRLFDYWLAHKGSAESEAGRVISAGELGEGLTILALPAMTEATRSAALAKLRAAPVAPEAKPLLDSFARSVTSAPVPGTEAGTREFDAAFVLERLRAPEANRRPPESEVRALFYRHALTRHTGKTDEEILGRLKRDQDINGSGAFTDEATMMRVVDATIRANYDTVAEWMKRVPDRAMIPLTYRGDTVVGRGLLRGEPAVNDKTGALVVLQKLDASTYRVVTGYPD